MVLDKLQGLVSSAHSEERFTTSEARKRTFQQAFWLKMCRPKPLLAFQIHVTKHLKWLEQDDALELQSKLLNPGFTLKRSAFALHLPRNLLPDSRTAQLPFKPLFHPLAFSFSI